MKKVFAFVMALALVMVGSVALAADASNQTIGVQGENTLSIPVNYSVEDVLDVTISWTTITEVDFKWNKTGWTITEKDTSTNYESQDVTFSATNNGFNDRKVTFTSNAGSNPFFTFTSMSGTQKTASHSSAATEVITITAVGPTTASAQTLENASANANITVTVTID